eukprot:jgi/Tetstr1/460907/TSEL_006062.t2
MWPAGFLLVAAVLLAVAAPPHWAVAQTAATLEETTVLLEWRDSLVEGSALTELWRENNLCSCCKDRIHCSGSNIVRLDLEGENIAGPLPEKLHTFPRLQGQYAHVLLSGNRLTGSLPPSWSEMSGLQKLSLAGNHLTGALPHAWGAALFRSESSGARLDLSNNRLTGSLPDAWAGMSALAALDIAGNELSGSLPDSWSALGSLAELHLGDNALAGALPASWSAMTSLGGSPAAFELAGNARLCGELPPGRPRSALTSSSAQETEVPTATASGTPDLETEARTFAPTPTPTPMPTTTPSDTDPRRPATPAPTNSITPPPVTTPVRPDATNAPPEERTATVTSGPFTPTATHATPSPSNSLTPAPVPAPPQPQPPLPPAPAPPPRPFPAAWTLRRADGADSNVPAGSEVSIAITPASPAAPTGRRLLQLRRNTTVDSAFWGGRVSCNLSHIAPDGAVAELPGAACVPSDHSPGAGHGLLAVARLFVAGQHALSATMCLWPEQPGGEPLCTGSREPLAVTVAAGPPSIATSSWQLAASELQEGAGAALLLSPADMFGNPASWLPGDGGELVVEVSGGGGPAEQLALGVAAPMPVPAGAQPTGAPQRLSFRWPRSGELRLVLLMRTGGELVAVGEPVEITVAPATAEVGGAGGLPLWVLLAVALGGGAVLVLGCLVGLLLWRRRCRAAREAGEKYGVGYAGESASSTNGGSGREEEEAEEAAVSCGKIHYEVDDSGSGGGNPVPLRQWYKAGGDKDALPPELRMQAAEVAVRPRLLSLEELSATGLSSPATSSRSNSLDARPTSVSRASSSAIILDIDDGGSHAEHASPHAAAAKQSVDTSTESGSEPSSDEDSSDSGSDSLAAGAAATPGVRSAGASTRRRERLPLVDDDVDSDDLSASSDEEEEGEDEEDGSDDDDCASSSDGDGDGDDDRADYDPVPGAEGSGGSGTATEGGSSRRGGDEERHDAEGDCSDSSGEVDCAEDPPLVESTGKSAVGIWGGLSFMRRGGKTAAAELAEDEPASETVAVADTEPSKRPALGGFLVRLSSFGKKQAAELEAGAECAESTALAKGSAKAGAEGADLPEPRPKAPPVATEESRAPHDAGATEHGSEAAPGGLTGTDPGSATEAPAGSSGGSVLDDAGTFTSLAAKYRQGATPAHARSPARPVHLSRNPKEEGERGAAEEGQPGAQLPDAEAPSPPAWSNLGARSPLTSGRLSSRRSSSRASQASTREASRSGGATPGRPRAASGMPLLSSVQQRLADMQREARSPAAGQAARRRNSSEAWDSEEEDLT